MRERVTRIVWRFVPDADQAWTIGLRLALSAGAYLASTLHPHLAWMAFLAKLFAMMGIWAVLGLWEKQFVSHLRRAIYLLWNWRSSTTSTADGPAT